MRKGRMVPVWTGAFIFLQAVSALVAVLAVPADTEESADQIVAVGTNLDGKVENVDVEQQPYTFSGTTMTPDTYGDIFFVG